MTIAAVGDRHLGLDGYFQFGSVGAARLTRTLDTARALDLAFRAESQILDLRIFAVLCGLTAFWAAHGGSGRGS